MKANVIRVHATGGPEQLTVESVDVPEPPAGHVQVRLEAAGVNFIDVYFRTGAYPRPTPFVAGLEGAGVVTALGQDVSGFVVGDRVAWASVPGSYAELVNAPAAALVKLPAAVAGDVAAAAMLQGMTAHYLCRSTYPAAAGHTALVHAAAGGVGLVLIQMLRRLGARVIGTCSSEEKEMLARNAGADHVIRYDRADVAEEVARITDAKRCDVVYDSVGQATFEGSLASLRPRGMLVLFGQSSGAVPPFDLQRLNASGSLFVTRPSLAHYTATRDELEWRAGDVLGDIANGELDIRVGARFALADAAAAHEALEGRRTTGKVLLIP